LGELGVGGGHNENAGQRVVRRLPSATVHVTER
jgi:hypothetical protein